MIRTFPVPVNLMAAALAIPNEGPDEFQPNSSKVMPDHGLIEFVQPISLCGQLETQAWIFTSWLNNFLVETTDLLNSRFTIRTIAGHEVKYSSIIHDERV